MPKPSLYNIKAPRYRNFGDGITKIVDDHKRMLEEEEAARVAAERNTRARRQFLLFLFFAIQVASIIYRDEINTATAALYARLTSSKTIDPRGASFAAAEARIKEISKDTQHRQNALDEIVPGMGGETIADTSRTAVDPDRPGRNIILIKDKSKQRDQVLNEITPGIITREHEDQQGMGH